VEIARGIPAGNRLCIQNTKLVLIHQGLPRLLPLTWVECAPPAWRDNAIESQIRTDMTTSSEQEAAIERMVRLFYERSLADDVLGPIFREAIHDWEPHIRTVADFWSGVIRGTDRYHGNAYAPHMKLTFEPEAFDHWLMAFESSVNDTLAPEDAATAIRVARHMANSFKAGMFPFIDRDGKPSRTPS
jgi:hemoglobin